MTLRCDLIIRDATIFDGSGNTRFQGDVGITGDRIAAIGDLSAATSDREVIATGNALAPGSAGEIAAEVLAILDHPELAPLFGPSSRAEVPLTGLVTGLDGVQSVVGGLVDRLAVLDGEVLLADYKTNRDPPQTAAETPVLYLRQLAAYRAVLREIFPGKNVRCALVWTRAARVVMLPDPLLDVHQPSAAPESRLASHA